MLRKILAAIITAISVIIVAREHREALSMPIIKGVYSKLAEED